jgi:uncharacterized protein (DUF362 family)/Pyruvate/2-oxoacid:ferredoxin oxidoreductase delta subunit
MPPVSPSQVAIVRADRYDPPELFAAVRRSLDLIGGLTGVVKRGDSVFVKINHLPPPSPPESGIVTHPLFTEAVLRMLLEAGADITVGDDIESNASFVPTGYTAMCKRAGVKLVNLREPGFVARKCDGRLLKEVYISRAVLEADIIIDLAKLKTHSLCALTGAIKNMYGCIPVGMRRRYHGDFLHFENFCQAIVDIYSVCPPALSLTDGILAREGEGSAGGRARKVGVILASRDAVALDATAGRIIGMEPWRVLTTRYAAERGFGNADPDRIEVLGEPITSVAVKGFRSPDVLVRTVAGKAPGGLARYFISQASPFPYVVRKNCSACGECAKICPTGAATMTDEYAEINHARCIRCMCCDEVCRSAAIVPRRPFLGRLVTGAVGVAKSVGGKRTSNPS